MTRIISLKLEIRFPSLNNFVMFCVASPESRMLSKVKPLVVPVDPDQVDHGRQAPGFWGG